MWPIIPVRELHLIGVAEQWITPTVKFHCVLWCNLMYRIFSDWSIYLNKIVIQLYFCNYTVHFSGISILKWFVCQKKSKAQGQTIKKIWIGKKTDLAFFAALECANCFTIPNSKISDKLLMYRPVRPCFLTNFKVSRIFCGLLFLAYLWGF